MEKTRHVKRFEVGQRFRVGPWVYTVTKRTPKTVTIEWDEPSPFNPREVRHETKRHLICDGADELGFEYVCHDWFYIKAYEAGVARHEDLYEPVAERCLRMFDCDEALKIDGCVKFHRLYESILGRWDVHRTLGTDDEDAIFMAFWALANIIGTTADELYETWRENSEEPVMA